MFAEPKAPKKGAKRNNLVCVNVAKHIEKDAELNLGEPSTYKALKKKISATRGLPKMGKLIKGTDITKIERWVDYYIDEEDENGDVSKVAVYKTSKHLKLGTIYFIGWPPDPKLNASSDHNDQFTPCVYMGQDKRARDDKMSVWFWGIETSVGRGIIPVDAMSLYEFDQYVNG